MKKLKRKLGLIYWECERKVKTWWYFQKKKWSRLFDWIRGWFCSNKIQREGLRQAECLVVCAHPDDETLYFSSVLGREKPFVICMSGLGSRCRKEEFYKALDRQGVYGVLLNMPDVPHMDWAWKLFAPKSLRRLARYCKQAKMVYTHNSRGESHHPHHYATSRAVKQAFTDCKIFQTVAEIPVSKNGRLPDEDRERKLSILRDCYTSQIKMLEGWYPWWTDYLENEPFEDVSNV